MKATVKTFAMLALMVGAASLVSAASIGVNPIQSIGVPVFGTNEGQPTAVLISTLPGYVPGDLISFTAVGETCFTSCAGSPLGGSNSTEVSVSAMTNPIIGGFLSSSTVSGFLSSGLPHVNVGPSGLDQWTTDPANTFIVTSVGTGFVSVPGSGTYVAFSFLDDLYADNHDASGTLGVNVAFEAPPSVPEPATYGMMIAGLGALVAFKRYRRS